MDVITVGGALRKGTAAHSGHLAERSLKAMDVRADIGILGTTTVQEEADKLSWGMACDSESEAAMKGLLLDYSDLRCAVVDSSKFGRVRSSAFVFAAMDPDRVDILLTDDGNIDNRTMRVIKNSGVLLLRAKK